MTMLAALVPGHGTTMSRILEALGIPILAPLVMIGVMIVVGFVEGLTDSFWAYSLSVKTAPSTVTLVMAPRTRRMKRGDGHGRNVAGGFDKTGRTGAR